MVFAGWTVVSGCPSPPRDEIGSGLIAWTIACWSGRYWDFGGGGCPLL